VRFVVKGFLDLAEVTGDDGISHVRSQARGVGCNLRIGQHGLWAALIQELLETIASRDRPQDFSKRRLW
jgi:hypothetical protein